MTAKDPAERYQDYDQLRFDITNLSEIGLIPAIESKPMSIDTLPTVRIETEEASVPQAYDVEPSYTQFGLDDFEREAVLLAERERHERKSYRGILLSAFSLFVVLSATVLFVKRKDLVNLFDKKGRDAAGPTTKAAPTPTPVPLPIPPGSLTIQEVSMEYIGLTAEEVTNLLGTPDFISDQKETLGALCYRSTRWDKPRFQCHGVVQRR
jgi:hypothetical protein